MAFFSDPVFFTGGFIRRLSKADVTNAAPKIAKERP